MKLINQLKIGIKLWIKYLKFKYSKWLSRYQRFKANPIYFIKEFYFFKISQFARTRKTKSLKFYFEELLAFILHYDVNSMKNDKEYIWPYIRNHLWIQISSVTLGKSSRRYLNPIAIQNAHPKQVPSEFRLSLKEHCDAYEIQELNDTKNCFLFFINTNGAEEISINNQIYHRIIDPIYEVAQKIGKSQKIEIVKSVNTDPVKWKKYHFKSKLIFLEDKEIETLTSNFQYTKNIFYLLKKYIPSIILKDGSHLNDIVNYELHIRQQYIKLLKKMKPKVVCLHGFHYQAPLISAADKLGILTVDLQHGLQVGWNPLYNHHEELPNSGYQAYPDYFAVWGEKEYNNILKTFHSKKHKPIYIGNPWLNKIEDFLTPLSENIISTINKYATTILIIMQNQPSIPQLFIDIVNSSDNSILWVVRHHPKGQKYKPKDFSTNRDVLIDDEIDNILFNELFKHIDIAISEGSSLALEASHYGVQNIITGETGKENYADEIKSGDFHYLTHADEFKSMLNDIQNSKKGKSLQPFKNIDIQIFLDELLLAAETKKSNEK